MNYDGLIKIEDLPGSDATDAEGLVKLAREAESFVLWHRWCGGIRQGYLDFDWYGILALFYFEIEPASPEADDRLWVVVGDAPPAYLDLESCPTETAAIEGYVDELQRWVAAVKAGQSIKELMPVYRRISLQRVEPTQRIAEDLQRRLDFLRSEIIAHMPQ